MELPALLGERARRARRIAEVGAGWRFDLARALRAAAPDVPLLLTDIDPRVLDAPEGVLALVDDATAPTLEAYEDVDLIVSVRPPEELQLAIARLARRLGADLALRPLKDEWADLAPAGYRRALPWGDGWRYHPA